MAAIIRLKRKACDEPAEGLIIALKKPKCELTDDNNEVIFKFAATINNEKESIRDHVQAALSKEKASKVSKWRDPKNIAISENKIKNLREKLQAEHKSANEKKKMDYLNNRRLILTEEFQELEDGSCKGAEIRKLFHLYDIIEENEDIKKQNEETESTITCNDVPLIREKVDDYVIDIYYVEGQIDPTFVDRTVDVRRLSLSNEQEIYFGGSDSEEHYEDEDDSNDENNWRNDYPEENSNSEKEKGSSDSESYSDEDYDAAVYQEAMTNAFRDFDIDGDGDDEFDEYAGVIKSRDYVWTSEDDDNED